MQMDSVFAQNIFRSGMVINVFLASFLIILILAKGSASHVQQDFSMMFHRVLPQTAHLIKSSIF